MFTYKNFIELSKAGYNRIPIYRDIFADIDTPLSTYMKIDKKSWTFLLESVEGGDKKGRYSTIGLPCNERIEIRGKIVYFYKKNLLFKIIKVNNPLLWIEEFKLYYKSPIIDNNLSFYGGLVGYFGYDTIFYIEPNILNINKPDPINVPDILLLVVNNLLVFDNISGRITLLTHANPADNKAFENAIKYLNELEFQLRNNFIKKHNSINKNIYNINKNVFYSFTENGYKNAVNRIKDYILAGDIMQCVLSQRISMNFNASGIDLYRALRSINPSPYMFYFNMDDHEIVGASPEIMIRLEGKNITLRPIAGTIHRGKTIEEDSLLEEELLSDPKERAEHIMLIDLGRNDISKVSKNCMVKLTDKMIIERYSHVMHIVSNITGVIKPEYSSIDLLKATFPAGTLSGAPKIRSIEIINEIEPIKRCIYSGIVGYISWQGNMEMAIAIRTAVIKNGKIHVQAGGGIVADSDHEKEWQETLNKRVAIFNAIIMAEKGLDNIN
ncbi:Anthranilate synthase component 1 [Candidatus Johnevansia muelleri]|uniref:Anthranilate synthase component 1 n=1 Tax=Candidatus Johnevansia muelleri TaxID=1495769 RepID=A0A078KI19_9GAMM|nr:Anthranilate synthase component 1 [Candidatus Evansia muelleri]